MDFGSDLDLRPNDLVIHTSWGVGRYMGVAPATKSTTEDLLRIDYIGASKYLPVGDLHKLIKTAPDTKLSDGDPKSWDARVAAYRAADAAWSASYANQSFAVTTGYAPAGPEYEAFVAEFIHQETQDQLAAISAIQADLSARQPMDRLIVGDVGFGKTEVAMRAAMLAVLASKQVAVVVPTGALAAQHYNTFRNRFGNQPVRVVLLTGKVSEPLDKTATQASIQKGTAHIVIGTHALLDPQTEFRDLGLLIIDEEHKFGAVQKDQIQRRKPDVHVLSMSATPIPRTLNLARMGHRSVSEINTPPTGRLPVKLVVAPPSPAVIRAAIENELARGGQVYYLHNRVATIYVRLAQLTALVPHARIAVLHGKLPQGEQTRVLADFGENRCDVLLATTVIEAGLDNDRANTIVIETGSTLGTAALHQLKGRVGRGRNVQGICYILAEAAAGGALRARLKTIQKNSDLGAGGEVAKQDSIDRGPGNAAGSEQTGHDVGVTTDVGLLHYLRHAVSERRAAENAARHGVVDEPVIKVPLSSSLPAAYIRNDTERLTYYRRMLAATTDKDVCDVAREMEHAHGDLPPPALTVVEIMRVRTAAKSLGIQSVAITKRKVVLAFAEGSQFTPAMTLKLTKTTNSPFSADASAHRLSYTLAYGEQDEFCVQAARGVLRVLTAIMGGDPR